MSADPQGQGPSAKEAAPAELSAQLSAQPSAQPSAQISTQPDPGAPPAPDTATLDRVSLLLWVACVLSVAGTALVKLDITGEVLIGCALVVVNYHWTRRFILRVFMDRASLGRTMVFYFLKFGLSVAVLAGSLVWLRLDPLGLLIGLSTIVEAIALNTVLQTIFPNKRHTEAG